MNQTISEESDFENCEIMGKRLGLRIDSFKPIDEIHFRQNCHECKRKRMYFCYDCRVFMQQVTNLAPQIQLPVQIDLIKHWLERNSKSTAVHCALTAPKQTRIFDSFDNVPDYSEYRNTVVVYPSKDAVSIEEYIQNNGPIQRFIFLDATWLTVGRLRNLQQLRTLPNVALKSYKTNYWRPQKGYSDEFLSTIEAIYYAVCENFDATQKYYKNIQSKSEDMSNKTNENEISISENKKYGKVVSEISTLKNEYNGQFDNLLFWFFYFRSKVMPEKRRNNR